MDIAKISVIVSSISFANSIAFTKRYTFYILPQGYDGEFCQNDADGCDLISCLDGQQCYDYPAPQVGAKCVCPDDYATDSDSKCVGQ